MKPGDFSLTPFTLRIPVFKFSFDFCRIPLLRRVFLKNRSCSQTGLFLGCAFPQFNSAFVDSISYIMPLQSLPMTNCRGTVETENGLVEKADLQVGLLAASFPMPDPHGIPHFCEFRFSTENSILWVSLRMVGQSSHYSSFLLFP